MLNPTGALSNAPATTFSPDMSQADYRASRENSEAEKQPAEKSKEEPSDAAAAKPADESAVDSETAENLELTEEEEPDPVKRAAGSKGGFRKRINRLTTERDELKRRLDEKEASAKPVEKPSDEADKAAAPPAYEKAKPKLEDFSGIEEFTEALTDWKADERDWKRGWADAQTARAAEAKKVFEIWQKQETAAQKEHSDYKTVVASCDDVLLSPAHQQIFLESELGAELAYQLAQNRPELVRIAGLSPLAAAREIGKLEAALSTKKAPTEQPQGSKAPEPFRTVGTARASGAGSIDVAKASHADYRAARESGRLT